MKYLWNVIQFTTSGTAGDGLGTTIMYLHAAAGIGLGKKIKNLRGDAGVGLGTTAKYLRRTTSAAAKNGQGPTIKYLVNQDAGTGRGKAHMHKSWARTQMNPPRA